MILITDRTALRTLMAEHALHRLAEQADRVLIPAPLVEALDSDGTLHQIVEAGMESLFEVVSLTQADEAMAATYDHVDGEALALMARRDLAADALLSDHPMLRAAARVEGYRPLSVADLLEGEVPVAAQESYATLALDEETASLLSSLVDQGVGRDASDVVRRALRLLAAGQP